MVAARGLSTRPDGLANLATITHGSRGYGVTPLPFVERVVDRVPALDLCIVCNESDSVCYRCS